MTSMRLEDQVQSNRAHVAKVSDLTILLGRIDTLRMGHTRVCDREIERKVYNHGRLLNE